MVQLNFAIVYRITSLFILCFSFYTATCCTCHYFKPITVEALLYEGLVFTGEVIEEKSTYETYNGEQYRVKSVAVFAVDKWFSFHDISDTVTVNTGSGMGDCGLTFSMGERWLMFVNERGGILYSSSCTSSTPISGNNKSILRPLKHLDSLSSITGPIKEKSHWINGSYTISGFLRNGKPVGKWIRTRARDTIAVFNFNDEGRRHGYQMEENEDYDQKLEAYHQATRDYVKVYSKSRILLSSLDLRNGKRDGVHEEYRNGTLCLRAFYIKGRLDGEWVSWHEDSAIAKGMIKTVKKFVHDRLISTVRYDKSGEVIKDY